jgi:hypothetical protein
MTTTTRVVASAAAVVAVLVGGAILLRPVPNAGPASPPPSAAAIAPSEAPSRLPALIPDGKYSAAPIAVADILAELEAAPDLDTAQKAAITDDILEIRDKSTLYIAFEVDGDRWIGSQSTDDDPPVLSDPWGISTVDATTIALATDCCGTQSYAVEWIGSDAFTVKPLSPAGAVETFVRHIVFESSPFEAAR